MDNKIIWCRNCLIPSTRPNVSFDKFNICSQCRNYKSKLQINWQYKKREFVELIKKIKKKKKLYDCVIPVSGGKDSTWQVIKCLQLGLKPLCVTWKTIFRTKIGEQNLKNLINLGVDHIDWTMNPKIEKKFIYKTFLTSGSTALPMHYAIFSIPLNVAYNFDIPLVVWGENSAVEYGNSSLADSQKFNKEWLKKYGVNNNTALSFWQSKLKKIDLRAYQSPSFKKIRRKNINIVFLGDYFKWDPLNSYNVAKKRGFLKIKKPITGSYNFADIDDDTISIHHWLKWYKFGFTREFDNFSIEIRSGRMSRKEAITKLKKLNFYTPPTLSIKKFCKYLEIDDKKFFRIAESFRNKNIWFKEKNKWRIKNFLLDNI